MMADLPGPLPALHVIYCRTCQRAWYDGDTCGCACTDASSPRYEDWVTDPDPAEIAPGAWVLPEDAGR
jgi:hypothetical protein